MKDYRIKITIRNDRLLSAIEGMGHESVMSFCKKYNLPYTSTNDLISGKKPPLKDDGSLTTRCKDLLEILGVSIEEAFTERQMEGFSKTTFETKVKEKDLLQIVNPAKNQEIKAIESDVSSKITEIMSSCLSPREEKVIRMRYGINKDKHCYTFEEIGLEFNITLERVRQIEERAIRKFREIKNSRDLLNTGFYETFTSVNIKPKQIQEAEFFGNIELEEKKKKIDYRNQLSKKMQKNYERLCNQVNKQKKFSDYKKQQIKNWIKSILNKSDTIETKYRLNFSSFYLYEYNWMYNQIVNIIGEAKSKGVSYERAKKLRDKLRTRKFIMLEPNKQNFFIYYKPKGEK
jgi:RNA polymerase sigma factor (sigma-70 family)